MDNMQFYEYFRAVPKEAQKEILGGRLKGMTDINPMWRIKVLTEMFGPCGIGWKYTIDKQWLENSMALDEITANVNITLYYKANGEWSDGIPGTGGAMFIAKEKNGLYCDDECYKKALTDAISVSCKALGIGADIYWQKDTTKYTKPNAPVTDPDDKMPQARLTALVDYCDKNHIKVPEGIEEWTNKQADEFKQSLKAQKEGEK